MFKIYVAKKELPLELPAKETKMLSCKFWTTLQEVTSLPAFVGICLFIISESFVWWIVLAFINSAEYETPIVRLRLSQLRMRY